MYFRIAVLEELQHKKIKLLFTKNVKIKLILKHKIINSLHKIIILTIKSKFNFILNIRYIKYFYKIDSKGCRYLNSLHKPLMFKQKLKHRVQISLVIYSKI